MSARHLLPGKGMFVGAPTKPDGGGGVASNIGRCGPDGRVPRATATGNGQANKKAIGPGRNFSMRSASDQTASRINRLKRRDHPVQQCRGCIVVLRMTPASGDTPSHIETRSGRYCRHEGAPEATETEAATCAKNARSDPHNRAKNH